MSFRLCSKSFNLGFSSTDVPAWFRKGRETRDQIASIHCVIEKAREFQKSIYFCLIDYAKTFDCVYHYKLWKTLKEVGRSDHLTASWETCMSFKKQQLEPDRHGIHMKQWPLQNWERSTTRLHIVTCLFNFSVVHTMHNARLDESQVVIKIAGRNINNLRYGDDTTLMA